MNKFLIETNFGLPFYKRKLFWIAIASFIIILMIIIIVIVATTNEDNNEEYIPCMCYDKIKNHPKIV